MANSPFGHNYRVDHPGSVLPEVRLVADARTEADIAEKRAPSYQVVGIGRDGRFELVTENGLASGKAMRFRDDPTAARAACASALAACRANAAAVDAAPDDEPMRGN